MDDNFLSPSFHAYDRSSRASSRKVSPRFPRRSPQVSRHVSCVSSSHAFSENLSASQVNLGPRKNPEKIEAVTKDMGPFLGEIYHFSQTTSAHGFPHIGFARSSFSRVWWTLCVTLTFCVFAYQATKMVEKFQRNEIIVNVELKFEKSNFPAVTLCNINPYKFSLVLGVGEIKKSLDVFEKAMSNSEGSTATTQVLKNTTTSAPTGNRIRRKRQMRGRHLAVYATCVCDSNSHSHECMAVHDGPRPSKDLKICICAHKRSFSGDDVNYPCFLPEHWEWDLCEGCSSLNLCHNRLNMKTTKRPTTTKPITTTNNDSNWNETGFSENQTTSLILTTTTPDPFSFHFTDPPKGPANCMCAVKFVATLCVKMVEDQLDNYWDMHTTTTTTPIPTTTEDVQLVEASGYGNMTDSVAITTKAKENIVFTMASIPLEKRVALSYAKEEFVRKCSFNSKQCTIDNDFNLHVDPVYGNCFVFNYNASINKTSSRSGATYGLRVLLFVNVSDYMPTTEATGVRMAVHEATEYPFPDSFGYSAPTGFQSSFGIRLKKIERLPHPYGDCVMDARTDDYIYSSSEYNAEGCHRSCFQKALVSQCGCGDPRFPVLPPDQHCTADAAHARDCLNRTTEEMGGFKGSSHACHCPLPCHQKVYDITYSAAKWPSLVSNTNLGGECNGSQRSCQEYYMENAVFLEVFFEQLNYELLKETEAYGTVNLLADFGGQLGLWMGVSVISCVEFIVFIWTLITLGCKRRKEQQQRKENERKAYTNGSTMPYIDELPF